jgi:hypothetical protein
VNTPYIHLCLPSWCFHIIPGNGQVLSLCEKQAATALSSSFTTASAARAMKKAGRHGISRRYCSACRRRCRIQGRHGCSRHHHGCSSVMGQLKHGRPEGKHRSCWKWHGNRRPRRHALRLHDGIHRRRRQADGHRLHLVLQRFHVMDGLVQRRGLVGLKMLSIISRVIRTQENN